MKNSVKTFIIALIGFALGVIVSFIALPFTVKAFEGKKEEIVIDYGDQFIDVPIKDNQGNSISLTGYSEDYTFVFYVDRFCGSCMDELRTVKQISELYKLMNVKSLVLWNGSISDNYVKKNGLEECSLVLEDAYIAGTTPTFFILDKDKKVIFKCNLIKDFISKLSEMNIADIATVNEKTVRPMSSQDGDDKKPIMLYFSMVGCPDCEFASKVIEENNLENEFEIITLYRDRENVPSELRAQVDNGNTLASIYKVDWYPTFLILKEDGSYEIVRRTEESELKETLLDCLK